MKSSRWKRGFGLIIVFLVCLVVVSPPFQYFASFPNQLNLFAGQGKTLQLSMPVSADVTVNDPSVVQINGLKKFSTHIDVNQPITLQTKHQGKTKIHLKLFGKIPLKTVAVNVLPNLKVIPGGQTIGVKLKSKGILVVGHHLVTVSKNEKISPGEIAHVNIGDYILQMNGKQVEDVSKVSEIVNESGKQKKSLDLEILRHHEKMHITLKPAFDVVDHAYRLGLYIRDSAAGVGTLTFYAPKQGIYGALGHVISDMDTQTPIVVGSGQILYSNVTSIAKSHNGEPGEKRANFFDEAKVLGNIEKNSDFGIYGKMYAFPSHGLITKPIPIALANEVKEGPAQIYTVINGQKVEKFDIKIVHVSHQISPETKGLVIKITDPKLLEKTGGIVQGMSGSPIIQNGKLIGAVTHVFVNDPTSGYGCFVEWMLQDAGLIHVKDNLQAS